MDVLCFLWLLSYKDQGLGLCSYECFWRKCDESSTGPYQEVWLEETETSAPTLDRGCSVLTNPVPRTLRRDSQARSLISQCFGLGRYLILAQRHVISLIKSSICINILLRRNRFYPFHRLFDCIPTHPSTLALRNHEVHQNHTEIPLFQSSVWPRSQYKGLECLHPHCRALFLLFTFIVWDELITELSQNEKWGWLFLPKTQQ